MGARPGAAALDLTADARHRRTTAVASAFPLTAATVLLLMLAGCGGNPRLRTAEPEPFPVSVPQVPPAPPIVNVPPTGPGTPTAETTVTGVRTPGGSGITPGDRQEFVMRARLDRLNVGVAAGGPGNAGEILRTAASSKLAEVGLRVRDLGSAARYEARSSYYLGRAGRDAFDVLIVLWGSASESDRFGNFYSYEARCRGRMVDPVDDTVIATRSATVRGKRALKAEDAEGSALAAGGAELARHLTDELVRKVEHRGYVMRVMLRGVKSTEELDKIAAYLQTKPGVAEARRVSWSKSSRRAKLLVRMHPGTKANLAAYLETVPKLTIEVTDLRSRDLSGRRIEEKKKRK